MRESESEKVNSEKDRDRERATLCAESKEWNVGSVYLCTACNDSVR